MTIPRIGAYKLKGKTPVFVKSIEEWGKWMEKGRGRTVRLTYLGAGHISTVFLGLDHNYEGGLPILFETMIFGLPGLDDYQTRYPTWETAVEGHWIAVRKATGIMQRRAEVQGFKKPVPDTRFRDILLDAGAWWGFGFPFFLNLGFVIYDLHQHLHRWWWGNALACLFALSMWLMPNFTYGRKYGWYDNLPTLRFKMRRIASWLYLPTITMEKHA